MITLVLLHVSHEMFAPGQILKLSSPTPHLQKYTRGFARATELSAEARHKFAKLREGRCSRCLYNSSCWINRSKEPCSLVKEVLHALEEMCHRAHEFVEHLFEWERMQHFPNLPSRFACFFCWERLEDALWFRREYRGGQGFVYRVQPAEYGVRLHRGDMKWLDCLMHDVQKIRKRACVYWRGEMCPDHGGGKWEVLVPCDLVVLEEVRFVGNSGPAEGGASPWNGSDRRG